MAKQLTSQKYILKLTTTRLKRAKWDLTLPLHEARKNDELIELSSSQELRWIDELNGVTDTDAKVREIRSQIRWIRRQKNTVQNRRKIKQLYDALDAVQFKPDYMHLVVDKPSDLLRACRGFKVNGIRYSRLLGTTNGVKTSTIVFVSERLVHTLRERIENGRDPDYKVIPAKYEAYRALTCSGSTPVSMPKGILVVKDCETVFREDIITISDCDGDEPEMKEEKNAEIVLNESDGYGMMSPELARRWSDELRLSYVASGMNTRFSWEKGMVFCFDFVRFADEVAHRHIVKDAWGNDVDIRNVELVLTTSMLKLWDAYPNLETYLKCCEENRYTFGIAKVTPDELDDMRSVNYQFLQGYRLTDDQIDELIQPTIDEIHSVLDGDYRQALLFLKGQNVTEGNAENESDYAARALMAEPEMFNDPYVKRRIYHMIERRIRDAKIGVVAVHGNYSVICGDPYALCQSIFGMKVTGLLKKGEIYSRYWCDCGAERVAAFRAPMTGMSNIRCMNVARGEELDDWYQHITTATLFNAWDSTTQALNGADKDGDLVFLTDNHVLVENFRPLPTLFCAQRKGTKIDVTEDALIRSNIACFGDDIGRVTNRVTSMYDVQDQFDPESEEYKTLEYRIMSGQKLQQDTIDRTKGIVCKEFPRSWYDRHVSAVKEGDDEETIHRKEMYMRIVADKKPYFMRYIYPVMMNEYNTFIRNTSIKCLREFRMELTELLASDESQWTDKQREFVRYYESRMPVGVNNCVMNRICRKFEAEFDGYIKKRVSNHEFDYSMLKSDAEYTKAQYYAVAEIYRQHMNRMQEYRRAKRVREREDDAGDCDHTNMIQGFARECMQICNNAAQLCNIVVDMCYGKSGTQQFAWDVCGDEMIANLMRRNDYMISVPVRDANGDITYHGRRFSMARIRSKYARNCTE